MWEKGEGCGRSRGGTPVEEEEKQSALRETPTKAWQWVVNAHSVVTLLLALVVAALVCLGCVMSRELDKDQGRISMARQEAWFSKWKMKEAQKALLQERLNLIRRGVHWVELGKEAEFWSARAVLVTKSGERYHAYGCSTIREDTEFFILDVESAVAQGYTPCALCHREEK